MRTTITLDEDVAAKIKTEVRRSGKPFKVVVNDCLRRGLVPVRSPGKKATFTVRARDLGNLHAGLGLDNIGELLDLLEGPVHR